MSGDLVERCKELLEWSKTGMLHGGSGGSVRALADKWRAKDVSEITALSVAESQTKDDAMRFVVAHADELASLRAQLASARKAAQFVKWAMQEGPWNGRELDGGEVQDTALKLGLLDHVPYDPDKHGESEFDIEPGEDWLVLKLEILALADEVGKVTK